MPDDLSAPTHAHAAQTGRHTADPLERLRGRVERAAQEIERLRTENAELAARVRALAEDDALEGAPDAAPPALRAADNPAELRSRIEGFILALDRVLAERASPAAPPAQGERAT